jgi:putative FmdB family regulatory protein
MPKYTFQCHDCSLRFERGLKMEDHPTHPCPQCREDSPRVISPFGFSFAASANPNANTGVHDHDYPTADKIVGRSAEQRWKTYHERNEIKEKVRQEAGASQLKRVDGDGYTEYSPLSKQAKVGRRKLVDLAVSAERADKSQ